MWELFEQYQEKTKNAPKQKPEQRKGTVVLPKDFEGELAAVVNIPAEIPLTMEGFEKHVYDQGLNGELSHYFSNKDGRYEDYKWVCKRIRTYIRADQIEGGMCNVYNPSITQRLNGLVDKTASEDKKDVTIRVIRGDRHKAK
jgi:hypothetical protein